MLNNLTILYSQNIGGDLALLPYFYNFLQGLKQGHDTSALLLDLGDSCAEDIWHCQATKGRSTLIALDGMGYHAANVRDLLADSEREKLKSSVSMGLVTERQAWRYFVPPVRDEDILVASVPIPALRLCIVLSPSDETTLENRTLHLQSVEKKQVGLVKIDLSAMTISEKNIISMPKGIKPDPTISAAVELVEEGARMLNNRSS
jgi:hypothetical protein